MFQAAECLLKIDLPSLFSKCRFGRIAKIGTRIFQRQLDSEPVRERRLADMVDVFGDRPCLGVATPLKHISVESFDCGSQDCSDNPLRRDRVGPVIKLTVEAALHTLFPSHRARLDGLPRTRDRIPTSPVRNYDLARARRQQDPNGRTRWRARPSSLAE